MRIDANVNVSDPFPLRIVRAIPDMEEILLRGGKLLLMTHRGRPKGREATLSTKSLIPRLELLLGRPVVFVPEFDVALCERAWKHQPAAVILFENLRFFDGEKDNARHFAKQMAAVADMYVNNAFGVCHRKHASVHRITKFLPSFAGSLLREEIHALSTAFVPPFVFVLGGAKLETKIPLLKKIAPRATRVLLGGAFALPRQQSLLVHMMRRMPNVFCVPQDLRIRKGQGIGVVDGSHIPQDTSVMDIGPETEMLYARMLLEAKSVLWNGPLGVIEEEDGRNGTLSMIDALRHARQARVVIGGGDVIGMIDAEDIGSHMFLSTGGGAMLTFLAGARMPGLDVL